MFERSPEPAAPAGAQQPGSANRPSPRDPIGPGERSAPGQPDAAPGRVPPTAQPLALAPDEVSVADVTAPDPADTTDVRLVSGTTTVPTPIAPRDGTIRGVPVYSSEHCPLLVDEADVVKTTVVEQHTGADGEYAGRTVHRYPEHVLSNPVQCPSCGVMREAHGLILNTETGERDCAIAIQRARNPKYTGQFGADAAARAQVNADSQDPATGPAAGGNDAYAGRVKPLSTHELASENERDEVRAARSATPSGDAPLTADEDGGTPV